MSEVLKERNEMDPAYMWDLSTLFHSDDEFEDALEAVKASVEDLAKYEGTLTNASAIKTFLDAEWCDVESDRYFLLCFFKKS